MTASGPAGISISYPTNTGSYSSLYKQSTLLADDTDYASLKITAGAGVAGNQTIALTIRYRFASSHSAGGSSTSGASASTGGSAVPPARAATAGGSSGTGNTSGNSGNANGVSNGNGGGNGGGNNGNGNGNGGSHSTSTTSTASSTTSTASSTTSATSSHSASSSTTTSSSASSSTTTSSSASSTTTTSSSTSSTATSSSASSCNVPSGQVIRHLQVTLPVVAFAGPAVQLVTTSVGPITAGAAAWVNVSYKANAPGVTDGRLTVTPPAGASATYPNNGTSSGFATNANLAVGQTDYASVKINTGTLKPGNYTLGLDLKYGSGTQLPGSVTLVVS